MEMAEIAEMVNVTDIRALHCSTPEVHFMEQKGS